jgi:hypothetical protein
MNSLHDFLDFQGAEQLLYRMTLIMIESSI